MKTLEFIRGFERKEKNLIIYEFKELFFGELFGETSFCCFQVHSNRCSHVWNDWLKIILRLKSIKLKTDIYWQYFCYTSLESMSFGNRFELSIHQIHTNWNQLSFSKQSNYLLGYVKTRKEQKAKTNGFWFNLFIKLILSFF